jgi:two-component system sensor histidine kinase BaeS
MSTVLVIATALLVHHSIRQGVQDYVNERQQNLLVELASRIESENNFEQLNSKTALHHFWLESRKHRGKHADKEPRKLPLLVLDNQKRLLAGRKRPGPYLYQVIKRDEQTIGFIALPVMRKLVETRDIQFLKRQQQNLWLLALFVIVLSAVFARLTAPLIVKPLLAITDAGEKLKQQQYNYRIASKRQDEIGALANTVDALAEQLEQAKIQRSRWLASTSHELRTPLAILKGEIEALIDGVRKPDQHYLNSLLDEVNQLERLTNDLQQLNLQRQSFEFENIDLAELITNNQEKIQKLLAEKNINCDFKLYEKAIIYADRSRLQQLLDNLMQNSRRYTDEGGRLSISLEKTKNDIKLVWQDSAPGVSDEDLQHLFDYLYRAEKSRNRQHGGFGLGLAIVKDIAQAHQASIEASHSELGGLKLTLIFRQLV